MPNITIRNIPEEIMQKIRRLSKIDKRSINNEILLLFEKTLDNKILLKNDSHNFISNTTQINMWQRLCGKWKDSRTTRKIIKDIISKRSEGRKIKI